MTNRRTECFRILRLVPLALVLGTGVALAQTQATSDVHPAAPIKPPNTSAAHGKRKTGPAPATSSTDREARKAAFTAPQASQFRPNGPITITADHAELIEGDSAVYTGNVKVDSDTLKMDGDRLELKQAKDGQYTAKITGNPAHLAHAGVGPDDPPVTAHAQTINYNSKTETVELSGKAQLTRGGNIVDGEDISYNLAKRQVQAGGGTGGQVKMVIQPPPPTHSDQYSDKPAAHDGSRH